MYIYMEKFRAVRMQREMGVSVMTHHQTSDIILPVCIYVPVTTERSWCTAKSLLEISATFIGLHTLITD